jgi:hypothetical protein
MKITNELLIPDLPCGATNMVYMGALVTGDRASPSR